MPLRMALQQTVAWGKATFMPPVSVHFDDAPHPVALWVRPAAAGRQQILVLFLEDELAEAENGSAPGTHDETTREQYLEGELHQSEVLRRSSEAQYATLLDESRAAYEGIQTLNEEYKSSLEELETSKEELQSVNEELQLVNQELHEKIQALGQAHSDLENFALATNIATLFLDRQLHIMRFTPGAAELFNLLPADLNRLITHLRPKVQYEELETDARQVMKTLTPVLREVYEPSGRWFLVQVLPYRTVKDALGGVVVTFTDITLSKEAELERRASELRFRQVWEATSDAMVLSDGEGVVLDANPAYLQLYGYTAEQVIGHSFALIFSPDAREAALAQYKQIFASEEHPPAFESVVQHADGSQRIVESRATFLRIDGQRTAMLSTIRDITERKQTEEALRHLNETLEDRVQARTEQVRSLATQLTMSEQEERRRISAILHDDLQQRLYGLNVQLVMLQGLLTREEQVEERQIVDESKQALRELIEVTRNLSVDLSPPVLHNEGLAEALQWLAAQMEQQQRLVVTVEAAVSLPVPDENLRVLLFQFVRELLFNIVKHARVDRANVALAMEDNLLAIQVSDQGQGFDVGTQHDLASQGLLRIKQRLQLMGGYMQLASAPGQGTRITLYVPLQRPETN
jgi:PAS domain S-box-containing protein